MFRLIFFLSMLSSVLFSGRTFAKCLPDSPKLVELDSSKLKAEEVYKGMPFNTGEIATYTVRYLGVLVGKVEIKVLPPELMEKQWLMSLEALMETEKWYETIFKARDIGKSFARSQSFAAYRYRGIQDHHKLFSSGYYEDKKFEFNSDICQVTENKEFKTKPQEIKQVDYMTDSTDELGAVFRLRTFDYELNNIVKYRVYTSGKDWMLEANPEKIEKITVPYGQYEAVRLDLKTYADKAYKQIGIVKVWIANNHPNKLMLKVEAEIKLGSFIFSLKEFKSGTSSEEQQKETSHALETSP